MTSTRRRACWSMPTIPPPGRTSPSSSGATPMATGGRGASANCSRTRTGDARQLRPHPARRHQRLRAATLPRLQALKLPAGDRAAPALALLRDWSGDMTMARPQPLIFNAWRQLFVAEVLRRNNIQEEDAPVIDDNFMLSLLGPNATPAAQAMWCGGGCDPILRETLDDAVAALQRRFGGDPASWRWGNVHAAIFAHPLLARLPLIGELGHRLNSRAGRRHHGRSFRPSARLSRILEASRRCAGRSSARSSTSPTSTEAGSSSPPGSRAIC